MKKNPTFPSMNHEKRRRFFGQITEKYLVKLPKNIAVIKIFERLMGW